MPGGKSLAREDREFLRQAALESPPSKIPPVKSHKILMNELAFERRRQFCARCGQLMFEFFRSPDGHFGVAQELGRGRGAGLSEVVCRTCGARYRLLDRVNPMGQSIERT